MLQVLVLDVAFKLDQDVVQQRVRNLFIHV